MPYTTPHPAVAGGAQSPRALLVNPPGWLVGLLLVVAVALLLGAAWGYRRHGVDTATRNEIVVNVSTLLCAGLAANWGVQLGGPVAGLVGGGVGTVVGLYALGPALVRAVDEGSTPE